MGSHLGDELVAEVRDGRHTYWSHDPTGIPAHGEVVFDLGGERFFGDRGNSRRLPGPGPLIFSGAVNATDVQGTRLTVPFLFTAPAAIGATSAPPCGS